MKWFKLYTDLAQHPRLRILAFEDRWHYVSLMCAKADGTLDEAPALRDKMLSVHLGLSAVEMDAVKDRLMDVELITEDWDIINWDDKQSADATGAARKRRQRARAKLPKEENRETRIKNKEQSVTVTGQSRDSHGTDNRFTEFYDAYPKKVGRGAAEKAYKKINESDHALVMQDLRRRSWPEDRKFIPNPSTYINQTRWLDEPDSASTKNNSGDFYV